MFRSGNSADAGNTDGFGRIMRPMVSVPFELYTPRGTFKLSSGKVAGAKIGRT